MLEAKTSSYSVYFFGACVLFMASRYDRSESRMLWLLALTGGFVVGRMPVRGFEFCCFSFAIE